MRHVRGVGAFRPHAIGFSAWLLLASLCVGCSPPTGRVTGIVTLADNPLGSGRVTFLCDGGKRPAISADISRTGSYEIAHVPPGRVRIAVQTFEPDRTQTPGIDGAAGSDPSPSGADPGPYVPIPNRYASPNKSGLEFVVVAGDQTFDIKLSKR